MPKLPSAADFERQTPQPDRNIVTYDGGKVGAALEFAGHVTTKLSDLVKVETDKLDTLQATDRLNQLKLKRIDLSVGENGYHRVKGGEVINRPFVDDYTAKFNNEVEGLASTLTPSQQEKFRRLAQGELVGYKADLGKHQMAEAMAHGNNVASQRMDNAIEMASAMYADEGKVIAAHNEILSGMMEAQKRNGLDDTQVESGLRKAYTKLYSRVIDAALANRDTATAQKYWEQHKDKFGVDEAVKTSMQLTKAVENDIVHEGVRQVVGGAVVNPTPYDRASGLAGGKGGGFDSSMSLTFKKEGGYASSDGYSKAPVNYGINQKANPDIDVKNLTRERAAAIYKERYWNAVGADKLRPDIAHIVFDAAVNQGVEFAKTLTSMGSVDEIAEARKARYNQTAKRSATDAKHLPAWLKRVDEAVAEAKGMNGFDSTMKANGNDVMSAWAASLVGQEEVNKAKELAQKTVEHNKQYMSAKAEARIGAIPRADEVNAPRHWISFLPEKAQSELARRQVEFENGGGAKEATEEEVRANARQYAASRNLSPEAAEKMETKAVTEFKHKTDAVKQERDRVLNSAKVRVENGTITHIDDLTPAERFALGGNIHALRNYIESQRKSDDADREMSAIGTELYHKLKMDSVALTSKSVAEVMELGKVLGKKRMNELLDKRERFINSPEKERAARIDNDMFKSMANKFGFNAKNENDRKELIDIKDRVDQEVMAIQEKEKRTVGAKEVREITTKYMTQVVVKKPPVELFGFTIYQGSEVARLHNVSNASGIVIPPDEIKKMQDAALRKGVSLDEREMRNLFIEKLRLQRIAGQ